MNVLLAQMHQAGQCSIGTCDFVRWSRHLEMVWDFELDKLHSREGYPYLIHWAERKHFHKTGFVRGDLLGLFEDYYYSRIPNGSQKRDDRLMARAETGITERMKRMVALSRKQIDLTKLLENDRHPTKEPNFAAFVK
jgi:hypothetical protein